MLNNTTMDSMPHSYCCGRCTEIMREETPEGLNFTDFQAYAAENLTTIPIAHAIVNSLAQAQRLTPITCSHASSAFQHVPPPWRAKARLARGSVYKPPLPTAERTLTFCSIGFEIIGSDIPRLPLTSSTTSKAFRAYYLLDYLQHSSAPSLDGFLIFRLCPSEAFGCLHIHQGPS